jgi:hypothetical protein
MLFDAAEVPAIGDDDSAWRIQDEEGGPLPARVRRVRHPGRCLLDGSAWDDGGGWREGRGDSDRVEQVALVPQRVMSNLNRRDLGGAPVDEDELVVRRIGFRDYGAEMNQGNLSTEMMGKGIEAFLSTLQLTVRLRESRVIGTGMVE